MENIDELPAEGEDISEAEAEEGEPVRLFLPKYPTNSFLRQVFCLSAVMALPYFGVVTMSLGVNRVKRDTRFEYLPTNYNLIEIQTAALGGVVGYIFGGIVWYLIGSKSLIVIANLLNLVLLALAVFLRGVTDQWSILYAIGFKNSFSHLAFLVYTAEISDDSFRAFFMGLYLMIDYAIRPNYNTLYDGKRLDTIYQISLWVAIPFLLLSLIVPETPFSAALKGNRRKARAIFEWIRSEEVDEFEYEMIIEKADNIVQYRDIVSTIFSSTFTICIITGIITNLVPADNDCDLLTYVGYHYYFQDVGSNYVVKDMAVKYFEGPAEYKYYCMMFGCLIYQGLCFYVPRKKLYTFAIALKFLVAVPMLAHVKSPAVKLTNPLCYVIPAMGITQTGNLLPMEIFPAALRFVGVTLSYMTNNVARYIRVRDGVRIDLLSKYLQTGNWTYFNIAVTLIGIPFILIYVPETMDINLYELKDFKNLPTDESTLLEEGTEYSITEEEKDDST